MNLFTIERKIPQVATTLVLIIIGASFALSYTALVELAMDAGIPPLLSPLWPLCLDAFMIVASLVVLRREMDGQPTLWAWVVVGGITIMSIAFNIIHAPHNLVSQAVYALPPLVVFASFEMLMSLIKSDIAKHPEEMKEPEPQQENTPPICTSNPDGSEPLVSFYREHPGATFTEAGAALGKSRQTVKRHVVQLVDAGRLIMDAKGNVSTSEVNG
jgi:hypothetical protein